MQTLWQDMRHALRMLAKSPGFTVVAVLTLALGIGANTAIFSVVNGILLRPLPYPESDRLVFLSEWSKEVPDMSISMENFNDWRTMNSTFESMVAARNQDVVLTGRGESERVRMRQISAGFFPTLRVKPIVGRILTPEDDKVGAQRVVLLGEGFWERRFGRDPNIVGQSVTLDGESYSIIGVIPNQKYHGTLRRIDVFASLWRLEDQLGGPTNRGNHPGIYAYARLKPGVTVEQARTDIVTIAERLAKQYRSNAGSSAVVQPLLGAIVEDVRSPLLFLVVAVGFVLLIACANIANLLLARATERHRELAVRSALGAGRWRLVRQLLTESVLLACMGGTLGLLLAVWITAMLVRATPASIPRIEEIAPDRWVFGFTLALSVFTGLFFGIFPALQASRTDIHEALKEGGRSGGSSAARRRLRDVLVSAEVAVSLVLLVGAGLMVKSLINVVLADGGFDARGVLTASFTLPEQKYKDDIKRRAFVEQLVAKLQAIPGVEFAGFKNPLLGGWQSALQVEGRPMPTAGEFPATDMGRITPDAMRAMGMRLLRGRFFDEHDNGTSQKVCIVDETLAKQHFPNEEPLGKRLSFGGPPPNGQKQEWWTIVGIIAHVKNYGVDQPSRVETYLPNAQDPAIGGRVVLRSKSVTGDLAGAMRAATQSIDPDVPLFDIRSLEDVVGENMASRWLSVTLIGSFAGLALLLAAVGIYGVMSYAVTQRTHEIGIRMALGANPSDVLGMVIRQGFRLAVAGIVVGLAGAFALSHLMTGLLYGVGAHDAATFSIGATLLAGVALAACYVPARRATRVDPIVALRYE